MSITSLSGTSTAGNLIIFTYSYIMRIPVLNLRCDWSGEKE